jgi:ABC-type sugar transport system ATPase subunit
MTDIRFENLRKEFDGGVVACDDLTLTLQSGTTTCLLGPSGCGKTTLMRLIAGLDSPTSGRIWFGETDVTQVSTRDRNLGMVFQYPVVYQGTTIRENVLLPLKHERMTASQRTTRADDVLFKLGLESIANQTVAGLDNATRQKVAVARAIARSAPVVLFDEPITNVDITAKLQLKRVLKELFTSLDQTVIYVTHDQTEAMTLADNIALMRNGRIEQIGPPRELYSASATRFAGWFLGQPGMNFIDLRLASPELQKLLAKTGDDDRKPIVGFRPEAVSVRPVAQPGWASAVMKHSTLATGGQHLVTLQTARQMVKAKLASTEYLDARPGATVWWNVDEVNIRRFDDADNINS